MIQFLKLIQNFWNEIVLKTEISLYINNRYDSFHGSLLSFISRSHVRLHMVTCCVFQRTSIDGISYLKKNIILLSLSVKILIKIT